MLNHHAASVAGFPATFATAREKKWKTELLNQVCAPTLAGNERGLELQFNVLALAPNGHPLDVDNLCEPVFAVLVGQLGWFSGARRNVHWWSAAKREGAPHGCAIKVLGDNSPGLPSEPPSLEEVYRGTLPRSAKEAELAEWAYSLVAISGRLPERCVLHLAFGSQTVNIADISTGVVKSFVDCLHPILGGRAGFPEDHRISQLIVEKGAAGLSLDEVRVRFWFEETRSTDAPMTAIPISRPSAVRGTNATNPCRPGSAKWIVAQGAIQKKLEADVRNELKSVNPNYEHRIREYMSDLRSENRFMVRIIDGRLCIDG